MPFYYDISTSISSNVTPATETYHLWGTTIANQETVGISGFYVDSRLATTGGLSLRLKTNTGTIASGGTANTPAKRSTRNPAAASTWADDTTGITLGTVLRTRISIGVAQTGGFGGWVAIEPQAKIQMQPNGANPVDVEISSIAVTASVLADMTLEFSEGM